MSDLYQQVQEIEERVNELETTPIQTDMNYDTMTNLTDFMQGNFWYFGQATLSSGTVAVSLPGISASSTPLLTPTSNLSTGGSGWATVSAACTQDTLTITDSGGGSRTVNYLVFI